MDLDHSVASHASLDELLWAGADGHAQAVRDGTVTAPVLLEAVLRRLDAVDTRLNSFRVVWAAEARAAAAEAQRRLDAVGAAPLGGVVAGRVARARVGRG